MDYLGKGEMLTNRETSKFVHILEKFVFLCIWNIKGIFYLMKHGTSTLDVAFIFLFSVVHIVEWSDGM